jgi:pyruvate formate lyase activating enzyme
MQEALFYTKKTDHQVKCELCPWFCELKPGQTGVCKVRTNVRGSLKTQVYNRVAAFGTDPVEKKPLYHFHPGKKIFSIGEVGCNLHCTFCQNHSISQCYASQYYDFYPMTSGQIIKQAIHIKNNIGIAYTYNEPFTFYEFMLDTAQLARQNGLKNVVVSNGYVNPEPLRNILPLIDAFNIDLKAFGNEFYQTQTKGKIEPVLKCLKLIAKNGNHLEITNLVIPGLNDNMSDFEKMVQWIAGETGNDTPLHLSRYFPGYKLKSPVTPLELLHKMYEIAKKYLHHVYLGNIINDGFSSTLCPGCGKTLIDREHYETEIALGFRGKCPGCGTKTKVIV